MVLDALTPNIVSCKKEEVKGAAISYENYHSTFGGDLAERKAKYADMVNKYYDLSTSFYEYGWGTSFHFANRWRGESHDASLKRHEHYLALRLGLTKECNVLDVGCGIGGPLREVARFTGSKVTGLNNNAYQISRAEHHTRKAGGSLLERCTYVKGDFMKQPFPDNHFDAIYEIDATCHAPDAVGCYKEIYRVLKPGQCFAGYEWCSTNLYDPLIEKHRLVMEDIELGNGLPTVRSTDEVIRCLALAGFEVLETEDLALKSEVPWYQELDPNRFSITSGALTTWYGRYITSAMTWTMETLRIAPEGTVRVHKFLERAADSLTTGGKLGIFTPVFFFLVRKPLATEANGVH